MAQDKKDMLHYEHILKAQGYEYIAGVDEAGRGPLAGPVVAAAVILNPENVPVDADDSKKLSASKRERLYDEIMQRALSVSVAVTGPERIDQINILRATLETMNNAISGLEITPDYILVDGNVLPPGHKNAAAIVKGDALSASIACASIIAKVTRDRLMTKLQKNIRSTALKSTRATAHATTCRPSPSTGCAPYTEKASAQGCVPPAPKPPRYPCAKQAIGARSLPQRMCKGWAWRYLSVISAAVSAK